MVLSILAFSSETTAFDISQVYDYFGLLCYMSIPYLEDSVFSNFCLDLGLYGYQEIALYLYN